MTELTARFNWPIPAWNADWQRWQTVFSDLVQNMDADVFATMSNMNLIMKQLPDVQITTSGGKWYLEMSDSAIFVSRALLTEIVVAREDLELTANSILGLTITPGAVGAQSVSWEVYTQGLDNAAEVVPVGYVDSSYNIIWYNGAQLTAGGVALGLFEFYGGGGTFLRGNGLVIVEEGATAADCGANLLSAYAVAKTLTPGGSALSTVNRATVLVPPGAYDLGTNYLDLDANYVDVMGFGVARYDSAYKAPDVIIGSSGTAGDGVVKVNVDDFQLRGLTIAHAVNGQSVATFYGSSGLNAVFKDVLLVCYTGLAGYAIEDTGGVGIAARFEDCSTVLPGFCYTTNFSGSAYRVRANGVYNFGGSSTSGAVCSGYFEDCICGDYSLGAGDGVSSFSGEAHKSICGDYSFGYSKSGNATCSGVLDSCEMGDNCAGHSSGLTGTFSGMARFCRCGSYCFGYTGDVTNTYGGICSGHLMALVATGNDNCGSSANLDNPNTLFSGTAISCFPGDNSLGALARMSGSCRDCRSDGDSFGGSGGSGYVDTGAEMINCENYDRVESWWFSTGIFRQCVFAMESGSTNEVARAKDPSTSDDPRFVGCEFVADTVTYSIVSDTGAARDIELYECTLSHPIGTNVTNTAGGTEDNFAAFDSSGLIKDSGYSPSDFERLGVYELTSATLAFSDPTIGTILVNHAGIVTITIASALIALDNLKFTVKDKGMNAATYPIYIETEGSEKIDEYSNYIINGDGDSMTFQTDSSNLWTV